MYLRFIVGFAAEAVDAGFEDVGVAHIHQYGDGGTVLCMFGEFY